MADDLGVTERTVRKYSTENEDEPLFTETEVSERRGKRAGNPHGARER